ncbi:hypothetical protein [Pseudaestuariivita rosea]|uniref:hypothetical protein n=1 Tax=Pseudaestuariivita rosea TaxID=2763263 RepID=UPI001ABA3909|nr:hypothetical protein [Pseudaestuariivita rosea]
MVLGGTSQILRHDGVEVTEGSYTFAETVDLTEVYTSRLSARLSQQYVLAMVYVGARFKHLIFEGDGSQKRLLRFGGLVLDLVGVRQLDHRHWCDLQFPRDHPKQCGQAKVHLHHIS